MLSFYWSLICMSSLIGNLLYDLPNDTKRLIRKYESTEKKLIKANFALIYNTTCINEDILPKYTNVKLHDPGARRTKGH